MKNISLLWAIYKLAAAFKHLFYIVMEASVNLQVFFLSKGCTVVLWLGLSPANKGSLDVIGPGLLASSHNAKTCLLGYWVIVNRA